MVSAISDAHRRAGDIAFARRTDHRFYGCRPDHTEWSASVVKAMLMVAYMNQPATAGRALTRRDKSLLGPMIRRSDNIAAQRVSDTVGQAGLRALARRVGMTRFATDPVWGETRVSARDQTKFFLHLASYIVPAHRSYAMRLLRSIVPGERWGRWQGRTEGLEAVFQRRPGMRNWPPRPSRASKAPAIIASNCRSLAAKPPAPCRSPPQSERYVTWSAGHRLATSFWTSGPGARCLCRCVIVIIRGRP